MIWKGKKMMKMYTSSEQTAKLMELGFVPKTKIKEVRVVLYEVTIVRDFNFTIGELIEILDNNGIIVNPIWILDSKDELIDVLYNTIIRLKKDKII